MLKKITLTCLGVLFSLTSVVSANVLHTGKVIEFKSAGGYTYIKLQEKDTTFWSAVPAVKVKVGDKLTIREQMWMENFKSKSLNKTFEKIMFADFPQRPKAMGTLRDKLDTNQTQMNNIHGIHGQMGKKPNPSFDKITISKEAPISTTIENLYINKDLYKNKNVEIIGEVVQVSNKVVGNTWVKLKGEKESAIFRSPNADEKVKKGDKVKVIATLNTDVDYGYGFKYSIIGVNGKFELVK